MRPSTPDPSRDVPDGGPGRRGTRGLGAATSTLLRLSDSAPVAIVVVALELALVTAVLLAVGGPPHAVLNLYYVPIAYAASVMGWRGAIGAAGSAGLLAGPLSPVLLGASAAADPTWLVRAVMYVAIGLLIATLAGQSRYPLTAALLDGAAARRMRRGLERRRFAAHVQPIVDLRSGRVVGAEALWRWRDSSGEAVPPSTFIPVAERTGVILDIGRFMLAEATRQCAEWSAQDLGHLVVNVNVSADQLSDRGFLGDLSTALAASGLRPEQLCMEITESAIIRNPEAALTTVRTAHDLGVRIALDDFGTGQSSLAYLQDFPIDIIKIDRAFVSNVDSDPRCSSLVLAIIEMAHALGAVCIAEGIERESQLTSLAVLGCEQGQGYFLGRPGPAPAPGEGWLLGATRAPQPETDVPGRTQHPSTPRPRRSDS
ncbi:putative bifunctional diguanylate cyclase/phosphodiesterase [Actinotalea sp.]|uniref:putative bifunctional diguanylate cyclase/phosphodiesterase n=1 Tax=Actinotalea sp. TaxID=1872145 RepID=UPI003561F2B9